MKLSKSKTALAVGAVLAVSAGTANAANTWSFTGTMTFINLLGVTEHVDTGVTGTFIIDFPTSVGSGSFASGIPFNGAPWTADVDQVFTAPGPGTYNWTNRNFDDGDFVDIQSCRTGNQIDGCTALIDDPLFNELGSGSPGPGYTFDNGAGSAGLGQFSVGMFFDWSTNNDIPVFAQFDILDDPNDGQFSVSSDGTPMATAPFLGQTAAFGGTMVCTDCAPPPIPVPAAVWLFGSGLLGLVGVARRKAKA